MKALNAQQMEFARLIAQGSKIAEAYRRAFDCSGKSQAAVTKAAQRLSKNVLVLDYVDTLRQETRREAIIDRVRRMELLSSMDLKVAELAPEVLEEAWRRAAGPVLGPRAQLVSVVKGVATLRTMHPLVHREIVMLRAALMQALNRELGEGSVSSIRVQRG